jgi:hypothetical protein
MSAALWGSEIDKLVDSVAASVGDEKTTAKFWTERLRVPILLAILIAAFNQLSPATFIYSMKALSASSRSVCPGLTR